MDESRFNLSRTQKTSEAVETNTSAVLSVVEDATVTYSSASKMISASVKSSDSKMKSSSVNFSTGSKVKSASVKSGDSKMKATSINFSSGSKVKSASVNLSTDAELKTAGVNTDEEEKSGDCCDMSDTSTKEGLIVKIPRVQRCSPFQALHGIPVISPNDLFLTIPLANARFKAKRKRNPPRNENIGQTISHESDLTPIGSVVLVTRGTGIPSRSRFRQAPLCPAYRRCRETVKKTVPKMYECCSDNIEINEPGTGSEEFEAGSFLSKDTRQRGDVSCHARGPVLRNLLEPIRETALRVKRLCRVKGKRKNCCCCYCNVEATSQNGLELPWKAQIGRDPFNPWRIAISHGDSTTGSLDERGPWVCEDCGTELADAGEFISSTSYRGKRGKSNREEESQTPQYRRAVRGYEKCEWPVSKGTEPPDGTAARTHRYDCQSMVWPGIRRTPSPKRDVNGGKGELAYKICPDCLNRGRINGSREYKEVQEKEVQVPERSLSGTGSVGKSAPTEASFWRTASLEFIEKRETRGNVELAWCYAFDPGWDPGRMAKDGKELDIPSSPDSKETVGPQSRSEETILALSKMASTEYEMAKTSVQRYEVESRSGKSDVKIEVKESLLLRHVQEYSVEVVEKVAVEEKPAENLCPCGCGYFEDGVNETCSCGCEASEEVIPDKKSHESCCCSATQEVLEQTRNDEKDIGKKMVNYSGIYSEATCGSREQVLPIRGTQEKLTEELDLEIQARKLQENIQNMKKENEYLRNQIESCRCITSKSDALSQLPPIRATYSGLLTAVDILQEKCKNKDGIIAALADGLKGSKNVGQIAQNLVVPCYECTYWDFDQCALYNYLRGFASSILLKEQESDSKCCVSETPSETESCQFSCTEPRPDEIIPVPTNFKVVREVCRCLLVSWSKPENITNVTGYEVFVNGVMTTRVRSPNRTEAILECLDLSASIEIALYSVGRTGRISEPVKTRYPS